MSSERRDQICYELERIRKANAGKLSPDHVLKAATNPKSVLHKEFIWDDKKAAEAQRLERAREIIITYATIVVVDKSRVITAPLYVRDPNAASDEQGSISINPAEIAEDDARRVMLNELARCESAIQRARNVVGVLATQYPNLNVELENLLSGLVRLKDDLAA
jgi:hypothetical protein